MQTFLPYPDFTKNAQCLDNKRLGKQRVECLQILKALSDPFYGWQNHPAVKMWRGYEGALCWYGYSICIEWVNRGFNDTCSGKMQIIDKAQFFNNPADNKPKFIGNYSFHASHRSNLLRKDPVHYGQFGWTEPHDLPYVWPTKM